MPAGPAPARTDKPFLTVPGVSDAGVGSGGGSGAGSSRAGGGRAGGALRILAIGDSITQGSVPSANQNHPYTIQLERRLEERLGTGVDVLNAGVGGAGIYAVGFNNPVTLVPWARAVLATGTLPPPAPQGLRLPWPLSALAAAMGAAASGGDAGAAYAGAAAAAAAPAPALAPAAASGVAGEWLVARMTDGSAEGVPARPGGGAVAGRVAVASVDGKGRTGVQQAQQGDGKAKGGAAAAAAAGPLPVAGVPAGTAKQFDWVIALIGINDLLREGKPAEEVMKGLGEIYGAALTAGTSVVAIPPLAAPGFVAQDDYKEGERTKLARLITSAATAWNADHPQGPVIAVLDLQGGPMNFWAMPPADRALWLDDGLHLTIKGYDKMGDIIADALVSRLL